MTKEGGAMKLLKIDDHLGHFLSNSGQYEPMDKLTKVDLLRLVDLTLQGEVEFDSYDEAAIRNQAHQIVYKSVHTKLFELASRRQEFTDESERLYLQDYERYRDALSPDGNS